MFLSSVFTRRTVGQGIDDLTERVKRSVYVAAFFEPIAFDARFGDLLAAGQVDQTHAAHFFAR